MGSQPLSQELIIALLDSNLFDLVKAVELIAGLGLLFGFYTSLSLLICLPVSFWVSIGMPHWKAGAHEPLYLVIQFYFAIPYSAWPITKAIAPCSPCAQR